MEAEALKENVRQKYGAIARASTPVSCCGPTSCCGAEGEVDMIGDAYHQIEGHVPEADLGLGCGVPTRAAGLAPGQTVVDLGAGAGNDVFIARRVVGETGRVIGVDMTPAMVAKARLNTQKLGFANVEFLLGEIERLPLPDGAADVVISNCVFNLVPDKARAFREVYRILKAGGHFAISDIVSSAPMPPRLKEVASLYTGCVSGALPLDDYLAIIAAAGFGEVEVRERRDIALPPEVLAEHLSPEELAQVQAADLKVMSVTLRAQRL